MFLFELENPEVVKFTARVSQLKHDVDIGKIDTDTFTKDDLLEYFEKSGINLDINDVYDMIKTPPLSTVIKNIQGEKVIFKGHDDTPENPDETQSQKVVGQMAQSAMK